MSEHERVGFAGALTCVIRNVRPAVDHSTAEALAKLLGEQLTRYRGSDHGMSEDELLATAWDLKAAANAGD